MPVLAGIHAECHGAWPGLLSALQEQGWQPAVDPAPSGMTGGGLDMMEHGRAGTLGLGSHVHATVHSPGAPSCLQAARGQLGPADSNLGLVLPGRPGAWGSGSAGRLNFILKGQPGVVGSALGSEVCPPGEPSEMSWAPPQTSGEVWVPAGGTIPRWNPRGERYHEPGPPEGVAVPSAQAPHSDLPPWELMLRGYAPQWAHPFRGAGHSAGRSPSSRIPAPGPTITMA